MAPGRTPHRAAAAVTAEHVGEPVGQIPLHVQSDRGTHAGERVHLPRIGELLLESHRGSRLQELAEPRAGIRESPGRQFDRESVERGGDPSLPSARA